MAVVRGAPVVGDGDIAVLGLGSSGERAATDFMHARSAQAWFPGFRRTFSHAEGEIESILKLKGHVVSTSFGDRAAVRVPVTGELPEARSDGACLEARPGRCGLRLGAALGLRRRNQVRTAQHRGRN